MGTRGGDGRLPRIRPRAGRGWRWPLGRHAGRAAWVALRAVSAAVPDGCRRAGLRAVHGRRAVRPHLRKRAGRWARGGLRNEKTSAARRLAEPISNKSNTCGWQCALPEFACIAP
ncbi:hypothetical protein DA2_3396 [Desulfovibrio sp. A2]|nr:hypothetical protein DA2_3396 [Desulfovibrio sp. A2]